MLPPRQSLRDELCLMPVLNNARCSRRKWEFQRGCRCLRPLTSGSVSRQEKQPCREARTAPPGGGTAPRRARGGCAREPPGEGDLPTPPARQCPALGLRGKRPPPQPRLPSRHVAIGRRGRAASPFACLEVPWLGCRKHSRLRV